MMLDPGYTDWPDGGGGPPYEPLQTTPNKRAWALFILAGLTMLPVFGWAGAELAGAGFTVAVLLYLGATYTWYKHNEETAERNKVLDTIEQL